MTATTGRLAWASFATTAALGATHGVLVLTGTAGLVGPDTGLNSFPIITAGSVLGALVGAMVATRQPRNPVGWLLLVGQLGTGIGLVGNAYAYRVLHDGELGPRFAGQLAVVVDSALGASWALSILAAAFLLFPDGSLPSRRWRPVLWALPVPSIATVGSVVLFVPVDTITTSGASSQGPHPIVTAVGAGSTILGILLLLLSVAALAARTRRARGERRQQMRWIATAASALVAGLVLAQVGRLGGDEAQVWGLVPLFVAYAGVPVAAGVAILRYRLYDIDIVIHRAVVGAVVVTFVTIGYVVVVVSLGVLVGEQAGDRYWTSIVATALVALAFQPLRRGVQRLGDRAVYGRRAAPYQALADLSRRLARAVSPDLILPGVAEAAGRSLGARTVMVRLEVDGADDVVARWDGTGAPAGVAATVPVRHGGRELGGITVSMPAGRRLSKGDRALLHDIATQSGVGMHNAQLAAQLRAQVERASAQADELQASRQRLLAAQESGRQQVKRAIDAEVLPLLGAVRPVLAQAQTGAAVPGRSLDDAVDLINQALEALRDIARGVFPPILARKGLGAALRRYAGRAGGRVRLVVSPSARTARFASHIEAVTYFCAVETVREFGGAARVDLDVDDVNMLLSVTAVDEGVLLAERGQPVVDRVLACGGSVAVMAEGGFAGLRVSMPVHAQPRPLDSAQTAASSAGPRADFGM